MDRVSISMSNPNSNRKDLLLRDTFKGTEISFLWICPQGGGDPSVDPLLRGCAWGRRKVSNARVLGFWMGRQSEGKWMEEMMLETKNWVFSLGFFGGQELSVAALSSLSLSLYGTTKRRWRRRRRKRRWKDFEKGGNGEKPCHSI
ncbi:unnamed protein product [Allacma fusca]|uniref:Uncharacterized protein n=1 Tax=Allacma fusca TaxID=39272 RepID=A0A8J2LU58_9HEXA|nr:unnamed protein product [Allacma fusca]